jgi:hypothetical protein
MEIKGKFLTIDGDDTRLTCLASGTFDLEQFPIQISLAATNASVAKLQGIYNSDSSDYLPNERHSVIPTLERAVGRRNTLLDVASHMLQAGFCDAKVIELF